MNLLSRRDDVAREHGEPRKRAKFQLKTKDNELLRDFASITAAGFDTPPRH